MSTRLIGIELDELDARLEAAVRRGFLPDPPAIKLSAMTAEKPPVSPQARPPKMLYFVQVGLVGPVKIGISTDLAARMRSLQTGHHEPLKLLASRAGSSVDETELHARFSRLRIRGEWFRPEPELLDYIARVSK